MRHGGASPRDHDYCRRFAARQSGLASGLALWMQTTGACLLAVNGCSLARVRMSAQDSRSAHGLLYLAAVRNDAREQGHCQDHVDIR